MKDIWTLDEMSFGQIVRMFRMRRRISVSNLAEISLPSKGTIHKWESHKSIKAFNELHDVFIDLGIKVSFEILHPEKIIIKKKGVFSFETYTPKVVSNSENPEG